jgi:hypothetical protein
MKGGGVVEMGDKPTTKKSVISIREVSAKTLNPPCAPATPERRRIFFITLSLFN